MAMTQEKSQLWNQSDESEDQATVARRIRRLTLHLTPTPPSSGGAAALLVPEGCAGGKKAAVVEVDNAELSLYMRGKHRDIQEKVYEYFNAQPHLHTPIEISKDDHRELCLKQLLGLVREAGIRPFRYVVEDPAKYFALAEAVGGIDVSLGIKMGVQYRYFCPTPSLLPPFLLFL